MCTAGRNLLKQFALKILNIEILNFVDYNVYMMKHDTFLLISNKMGKLTNSSKFFCTMISGEQYGFVDGRSNAR